jgi:aryl-alcohol dehydrogenase-like predicted oxidoreductase
MGITSFYGKPMDDNDAVALMKHAFDAGVTHFDTAEVYRCKAEDGETVIFNEVVVGKALAVMGRENVQVATKYYPALHSEEEMSPESVVAACKASCDRLGVACIDLYYLHRIHPTATVEDQAAAMAACVAAGLAKHVGVSEFSPENLRRFHAVCPVTCVQQEWSLVNRDLEEELVPCCRELGIGIVAYSPLCRSLLCGEVKSQADLREGDLRASRYPRFAAENLTQNAQVASSVAGLAQARGVTPAQLSLAWVSSQGKDVVPIPGTTKVAHLDDNLAARAVLLSEEECALVAAAVPLDQMAGDRYVGGADANTFRAQMK